MPESSDEASSLSAGARFQRLVEIMARLRAPGGCPWDREQTYDSIKPYTVEETYEVMDAIDRRDFQSLAEELGDLTLQVVFYAQIAAEEGRFTVSDSLDAINAKLIRRHPHVFSDGDAKTSEQVLKRWDEIKKEEKRDKGEAPQGLLDTVVRQRASLIRDKHTQIHAAVAAWLNTIPHSSATFNLKRRCVWFPHQVPPLTKSPLSQRGANEGLVSCWPSRLNRTATPTHHGAARAPRRYQPCWL
jgi:NTP pyrophosphatase (non-canonical NTP hydrolase)